MRIAVLAPVAWRTPPRHYGPWEQVSSNIAEALVKEGFDVTLFATGDSLTNARLEWVSERGYEEDKSIDAKVVECLHISHLMECADEFDLIHNNFDFLPLTYSSLVKTPFITTIHGFSSEKIIPVYKKYNHSTGYVSISNANRHADLDYLGTVYNGIQTEQFSFNPFPDDYLLFFGRIHPDKGTTEAIEIARRSNRRLIIAGIIQDAGYFREKVEPFLSDTIVFAGEAGPEKRNELLGRASALLHPISFDEPFGLSVAESMFCGTPVIAFNRGSMPELIRHEETGFLVASVGEAVEAVELLKTINRHDCYNWSHNQFSTKKMVQDYIKLYNKMLSGF